VVIACVVVGGCGSSSPTSPSQGPTPSPQPAPSQPAFQTTITGNAAIFGFNQHSLTSARGGQMRVVLSWTNGAIDLDLYLTDSTCNTYPPIHCTALATSAVSSGTSELITRTVTSGEQFKVWVDNFHQTLSSDYTIEVTIQ
jgi:hypothetical protein